MSEMLKYFSTNKNQLGGDQRVNASAHPLYVRVVCVFVCVHRLKLWLGPIINDYNKGQAMSSRLSDLSYLSG